MCVIWKDQDVWSGYQYLHGYYLLQLQSGYLLHAWYFASYMGLSALQHVRVHDAWLRPGTDCIAKHDGYSASICSKYTDELACSIPSYNRGLVCIANIKTTFEYVLHTKTKGNSGLCSFFYFFHTLWVSL